MQKRNLILIVAVVALLLLGWLLGRSGGTDDSVEGIGKPLLPGVAADVNQVTGLKLSGAGGEVIAEVRRDGEQWTVVSSHGYPADVSVVRRFLLALKDAVKRDVRTSKPERYASIGVEDPLENADAKGMLVELQGVAEPTRAIIGTYAAGGGDHTYARLADQPQSWLVSGNLIPEKTAGNWLARDLVDVPSSRVLSVAITDPDGKTLNLVKPNESDINYTVQDVPKGRELSSESVGNAIAGVLGSLQLEGVRPAADAAVPESGVYTGRYLTREGLVITLQGWEDGEKRLLRLQAAVDPTTIEAWATQEQARREAAAASAAAVSEASAAAEGGDQASEDAEAAAEQADAEPADPAAAVAAIVQEQTSTVQAEADAINARTQAWTFEVPTWKYANLAKRMEDLLKPKEG
ncbi:MAG: DUF4340 domain-containing protein [Xanthomonadales bacterium]|nr:DUF4340 domain-containing protein [Xanthomonadales bacterium]